MNINQQKHTANFLLIQAMKDTKLRQQGKNKGQDIQLPQRKLWYSLIQVVLKIF